MDGSFQPPAPPPGGYVHPRQAVADPNGGYAYQPQQVPAAPGGAYAYPPQAVYPVVVPLAYPPGGVEYHDPRPSAVAYGAPGPFPASPGGVHGPPGPLPAPHPGELASEEHFRSVLSSAIPRGDDTPLKSSIVAAPRAPGRSQEDPVQYVTVPAPSVGGPQYLPDAPGQKTPGVPVQPIGGEPGASRSVPEPYRVPTQAPRIAPGGANAPQAEGECARCHLRVTGVGISLPNGRGGAWAFHVPCAPISDLEKVGILENAADSLLAGRRVSGDAREELNKWQSDHGRIQEQLIRLQDDYAAQRTSMELLQTDYMLLKHDMDGAVATNVAYHKAYGDPPEDAPLPAPPSPVAGDGDTVRDAPLYGGVIMPDANHEITGDGVTAYQHATCGDGTSGADTTAYQHVICANDTPSRVTAAPVYNVVFSRRILTGPIPSESDLRAMAATWLPIAPAHGLLVTAPGIGSVNVVSVEVDVVSGVIVAHLSLDFSCVGTEGTPDLLRAGGDNVLPRRTIEVAIAEYEANGWTMVRPAPPAEDAPLGEPLSGDGESESDGVSASVVGDGGDGGGGGVTTAAPRGSSGHRLRDFTYMLKNEDPTSGAGDEPVFNVVTVDGVTTVTQEKP